jgi:phage terminase large subunit-like protein
MDIALELKIYSEDVLAGKIPANKKHRYACIRYLNDLAKSQDPAYPYRFDNEKAERFFAWCRLFTHKKGVLRGQYIELAPILRFITGNLFGWVNKRTGFRRFTKFYWQVARKNAKSQTLSLILTYLCFADGEGAAEIYCAATKKDQARVVYDECVSMVRQGLPKDKYRIRYGRIEHPKSESFIRAMSKEDRKKGDGYNPHGCSIDEYHAHDTSEVYDVMWSGMGAREQPLHCTITTAGFELAFPCPRIEYVLVGKILDPNIDFNIDNYFCMVNELDKDDEGNLIDDIRDEKCWIKANPIVCSYESGIKSIRDSFNEAIGIPEKMRDFLTKRMNIWVNMRECGYMDLEKWKSCYLSFDKYPDLKGVPCFVGIDMSAKIDLSSVGFIWPYKDCYYTFSHSFMPEETVAIKMKTDKVPYMEWIKAGYITATPGGAIDYRFIKNWILDTVKERGWKIAEFAVDGWGAIQLMGDLIEIGYKDRVIEIVQGIKTLSEPTKDFRNMVYTKRLFHPGDPVLGWAMSNAIIDDNNREKNIILDKKKSIQRIDPVTSLINAHVRAMFAKMPASPKILFIK